LRGCWLRTFGVAGPLSRCCIAVRSGRDALISFARSPVGPGKILLSLLAAGIVVSHPGSFIAGDRRGDILCRGCNLQLPDSPSLTPVGLRGRSFDRIRSIGFMLPRGRAATRTWALPSIQWEGLGTGAGFGHCSPAGSRGVGDFGAASTLLWFGQSS